MVLVPRVISILADSALHSLFVNGVRIDKGGWRGRDGKFWIYDAPHRFELPNEEIKVISLLIIFTGKSRAPVNHIGGFRIDGDEFWTSTSNWYCTTQKLQSNGTRKWYDPDYEGTEFYSVNEVDRETNVKYNRTATLIWSVQGINPKARWIWFRSYGGDQGKLGQRATVRCKGYYYSEFNHIHLDLLLLTIHFIVISVCLRKIK